MDNPRFTPPGLCRNPKRGNDYLVPTLCVGMPSGTLPRPRASADHAERGRRHSHGDRGNEEASSAVVFGGSPEMPLKSGFISIRNSEFVIRNRFLHNILSAHEDRVLSGLLFALLSSVPGGINCFLAADGKLSGIAQSGQSGAEPQGRVHIADSNLPRLADEVGKLTEGGASHRPDVLEVENKVPWQIGPDERIELLAELAPWKGSAISRLRNSIATTPGSGSAMNSYVI